MKFRYFLFIITIFASIVGSYFLYKNYVNKQLIQAVKSNDIELAKKALRWGADINHDGGFKSTLTPLTGAIKYGYPEMVQFLLDNAASTENILFSRNALEYSQEILNGSIKVVAPRQAVKEWAIVVEKQKEIVPIIKREIKKRASK